MAVNEIDVMLQDKITQGTQDAEIEFAAFLNLVEGQPTGTCLVCDTKLSIPYIPDIDYYNIHQCAVMLLSRQQNCLIGSAAPFICITKLKQTNISHDLFLPPKAICHLHTGQRMAHLHDTIV